MTILPSIFSCSGMICEALMGIFVISPMGRGSFSFSGSSEEVGPNQVEMTIIPLQLLQNFGVPILIRGQMGNLA